MNQLADDVDADVGEVLGRITSSFLSQPANSPHRGPPRSGAIVRKQTERFSEGRSGKVCFWRAPCKGGAFQWVQALAPAGSNPSSHGGDEILKPSISVSRIGDSASVQAATRVNAVQASKRTMCRPTRLPFRGRLTRLGGMSEYSQPLHRSIGGSMYTRKRTQQGKPQGVVSDDWARSRR